MRSPHCHAAPGPAPNVVQEDRGDGPSLSGVHLDSPQVTIKPSLIGSTWYLTVEGYNTAAKVERIK